VKFAQFCGTSSSSSSYNSNTHNDKIQQLIR
jgi:hypothetical protein